MSVRTPALRVPPITFAHRGAMDQARENTLEAFELALALGASGLESDAWLTADGQVVLDHDGVLGRWPRRQQVADLPRSALPAHVPTLEDLYATCGVDYELSLGVKDPAVVEAVLAVARAAGSDACRRLWLCHPDLQVLSSWRRIAPDVRLADSTRVSSIPEGVRQRAANLADRGIDAVNMHWLDWSDVYADLFHGAGVYVFAWDVQKPEVLARMIELPADGVYSDHVDLMTAALSS